MKLQLSNYLTKIERPDRIETQDPKNASRGASANQLFLIFSRAARAGRLGAPVRNRCPGSENHDIVTVRISFLRWRAGSLSQEARRGIRCRARVQLFQLGVENAQAARKD